MFSGDMDAAARGFNGMCNNLITKGVLSAPDESTRTFCAIVSIGFQEWYNDYMCKDTTFRGYDHLYGTNGAHALRAIDNCKLMTSVLSPDFLFSS